MRLAVESLSSFQCAVPSEQQGAIRILEVEPWFKELFVSLSECCERKLRDEFEFCLFRVIWNESACEIRFRNCRLGFNTFKLLEAAIFWFIVC